MAAKGRCGIQRQHNLTHYIKSVPEVTANGMRKLNSYSAE